MQCKFNVGDEVKVKRYRYGVVAAIFATHYGDVRIVVDFADNSYSTYRECDLLDVKELNNGA